MHEGDSTLDLSEKVLMKLSPQEDNEGIKSILSDIKGIIALNDGNEEDILSKYCELTSEEKDRFKARFGRETIYKDRYSVNGLDEIMKFVYGGLGKDGYKKFKKLVPR